MATTRRAFLGASLGSAAVALAGEKPQTVDARKYLSKIIYKREDVDAWLGGNKFPFASYHGQWGWLLRDARMVDGIDGSTSTYVYSRGPYRERRMIAHADRPCRINTYGDSFTMCHQVNDGESWQEVLASHLCEPVRNFGIGAWSVYQAYLRMKYEEQRCPANVIILNIYDDDHYRNLDAWRCIRCNADMRFLSPTLPHLQISLDTGDCTEHPNPCPTAESVYNLCDLDWVADRFKDDFVLQIELAHANSRKNNPDQAYQAIMDLVRTHGINTRVDRSKTASTTARELHTKAALTASMKIVEWTEAFAKQHGKKVLYVLSFNARNIARRIREGTRFDQPFVDFLKKKNLPFVDLMAAHVRDYAPFKVDVKTYLERYYIGHYNPLGNHFTAFAIKDKLVEMLDPKPMTYQPA